MAVAGAEIADLHTIAETYLQNGLARRTEMRAHVYKIARAPLHLAHNQQLRILLPKSPYLWTTVNYREILTSYGWKIEVLPKKLVVLDCVGNRVEHILSYLEFCLEQSNKILAIVGIHPHTVLQAHEAYLLHNCAQAIPNAAPALRYVEHNHSPAAIPFPLLILESYFCLLKYKCLTACWSYPKIFLPIPFNPLCISLSH